MLTWYRDLGTAERVDIGQQADRGDGVSVGLEFSRDAAALLLGPRDASRRIAGDPYALQLDPRFDRVAQRIEQMAIRLHPKASTRST